VVTLLAFSLIGGYVIHPQLHEWHLTMYRPGVPVEEQESVAGKFRMLHGLSQVMNLVIVVGVMVYLVRVTKAPTEAPRYRFQ
jgi:hypothetical protein